MQPNIGTYFSSESADILCEQFNKYDNTLKKQKEETDEKYPWLEKDDERKNMSDKEILERYVNLERTCLSEVEKKEVMDMLYRYKNEFS